MSLTHQEIMCAFA